MYIRDYDIFSGGAVDPPEIIWDLKDRYAIIAFLLLSVDKKAGSEELKKLDAFMGITETEEKNNDSEENNSFVQKLWFMNLPNKNQSLKPQTVMDAIVRECGTFLDGLEQDENRCDCIIDEIDHIIEGSDKCGIGGGYGLRDEDEDEETSQFDELLGNADQLLKYLKLVVLDEDYSKNQKRILKHLARKWDIDKSILPILEKSIKSLDKISRKRAEVENSDIPYRKAVSELAEIDAEEKMVWEELNKLHNITKDIPIAALVTGTAAIASGVKTLFSVAQTFFGNDKVEEEEEESLTDKIGDGIVEGIFEVGDLICAPFDWLTEKISSLP